MQINNLTLDISSSGRLAELRLNNGRIIAQFLVHGLLKRVSENCISANEILVGRPNIFRGELFQLASYEYLNREEERIEEKI